MIEQFLPNIKDPADYIRALTLFRVTAPMTKGEVDALLELYGKYLPEVDDPEYIKTCLAVDLLPGRTRENKTDLAALDLEERELEAIFTVKDMITGKADVDAEEADEIVETVENENLALPVRVLLARSALDWLAGSRDYAQRKPQIEALAQFLIGVGMELDRYTALLGEVRVKCRN